MTIIEQEAISSLTHSRRPMYSDHIYIGICTRKRPKMLEVLLNSLLETLIPDTSKVTICIVENDLSPFNKPLVEQKAHNSWLNFVYALEPQIGISKARNTLLLMALKANASLLVFIDDDEQVSKDWLTKLYECFISTDRNTIIQGSVTPRMENDKDNSWLPFFYRKTRHTGDNLLYCATNNTLIPLELVKKHKLHFDTSLDKSGGEDTLFFARAKEHGVKLIYCKEAAVFETVPTTRANLRWLSKRKLRVGILAGSGKLPNKPKSLLRLTFYILKTAICLLQAAIFTVTFQRNRSIRAWLNACKHIGSCLGYFKMNINTYKNIQGY